MPALTLPVVIGSDHDFPLVANDGSGGPAAGLLASDTLSAVVWAGADQAPLFLPAATWVDAQSASYTLSVSAAQSATLATGLYRVQAFIQRSGRTGCILDGWLEAEESAGAATPRPSYNTAADVRKHLPWGDDYNGSPSVQAGFAVERGDARDWIEECILRAAPSRGACGGGYHRSFVAGWGRGALAESAWLRAKLAAGALMVTPTLVRIVSLYAAAQVLRKQVASKPGDTSRTRGIELLVEAHAAAQQYTAELDLDGDGLCDLAVPLGVTATRYA